MQELPLLLKFEHCSHASQELALLLPPLSGTIFSDSVLFKFDVSPPLEQFLTLKFNIEVLVPILIAQRSFHKIVLFHGSV